MGFCSPKFTSFPHNWTDPLKLFLSKIAKNIQTLQFCCIRSKPINNLQMQCKFSTWLFFENWFLLKNILGQKFQICFTESLWFFLYIVLAENFWNRKCKKLFDMKKSIFVFLLAKKNMNDSANFLWEKVTVNMLSNRYE